MYAPRMIIAPWATLITFITPNASVRPLAINAYTPPVSSPRMQAWMARCMERRAGRSARPGGLRRLRGVLCEGGGEHRQQLAADPLRQELRARRRADGVAAQVALDRRPPALVQRRDDRLVVDRAGLLGHVLDQLA